MRFLTAVGLMFLTATAVLGQGKHQVPTAPPPLSDNAVRVVRSRWAETIKPYLGDYNLFMCSKACESLQVTLEQGVGSYADIAVEAELDLKQSAVSDLAKPFSFELTDVHIAPVSGIVNMELHWYPSQDHASYYRLILLANPGKKRVVGFFSQMLTSFVRKDGKVITDVPISSASVFMEQGTRDVLPLFSSNVKVICEDLQILGDDAVSKVMSLWVSGHYAPRKRDSGGKPASGLGTINANSNS